MKTVAIIAGFCILSVAVALVFLSRPPPYVNGEVAASAGGYIIDKDPMNTDNFKNGKLTVEILVWAGRFREILNPTNPMKIKVDGRPTIESRFQTWSIPAINLRDNTGKTEANYGENIVGDGVVPGSEDSNDNLYVKISVPTTLNGDVVEGMTIKIEMWPTNDAASPVDGIISPASFDNATVYDWWDEGNVIDVTIVGKNEIRLAGYTGAYLIGVEVDNYQENDFNVDVS
jgi:hypothetical protein